jgi:hypothetical protein
VVWLTLHTCVPLVPEDLVHLRPSHGVSDIFTIDTGVLVCSSDPHLCKKDRTTSTLCRVRMTSRFPTAAELASFPEPNYVSPSTRRPLAIGIITPMTVLVVAFISCRFYSRTVLTKTLGWDDGIMLLAAVSLRIPSLELRKKHSDQTRSCQWAITSW